MKSTIEAYNKLVDLMNEIQDKGFNVHDYHSSEEGYGFNFYLEEGSYYVKVDVWNQISKIGYDIKVKRCGIDNFRCAADKVLDEEYTEDVKEVKRIIYYYIEKYPKEMLKMEPKVALKDLIAALKKGNTEGTEKMEIIIQEALNELESLHQAYNEQYYQNTTLLNKCLNLESENKRLKRSNDNLNHQVQTLKQKFELFEPVRVQSENKDFSIDVLNLSQRAYNCLKRASITTIEMLASKDAIELLKIRGLGEANLKEIEEKLHMFLRGDLDV